MSTSTDRPPLALDVMGGDKAPHEPVAAAIAVARDDGIPVALVGRAIEIDPLLDELGGRHPLLTVVDAPEVVTMEEHAVAAVRRKARSSITVACELVRDGQASAVVSAGHSGALVAAAIFILGREPGIERPGIATPFPTLNGSRVYLIDAGAVVDARPAHLVGFAGLIRDYLQQVEGVAIPRIALLSNGEEPGKGTSLVREVHMLLESDPRITFVGNVEGNDLTSGSADAVITDGFTGNVALKTAEGAIALLQGTLRQELTRRWYSTLLAAALRPAFRRVAKALDYREYGGAPLLGVRGTVFIAHGRSDRRAIVSALRAAQRAAARGPAKGTA